MRTPSAPSKRPPLPPWMRPLSERLSPTISRLLIVLSLPFLTGLFVPTARLFFQEHLALGPGFFAGELWQPVSALAIHLDPLGFVFGMLGLWFAGATVERELGRTRFLLVLLAPALAANLVMVISSKLIGRIEIFPPGLSLGILSLFVAIGRIYDRAATRVLGGMIMEARWLAALVVGFSVFSDLLRGAWAMVLGDLAAIGLAYVLSSRKPDRWRAVIEDLTGRGPPKRKFKVMEGGRGRGPDGPGYLN